MGPNEISGLPAHVLIVHFVVVAVPLAAAMLLASALWPAAGRRLGVATPLVALITLASVPVATHAGEWLERRVEPDPLVRAHTQLGDTLLPWVIGLFAVAAAVWAVERFASKTAGPARTTQTPESVSARQEQRVRSTLSRFPVRAGLGLLAVLVTVGSVVQVYRIGESGSRAAWHDDYHLQPTGSD